MVGEPDEVPSQFAWRPIGLAELRAISLSPGRLADRLLWMYPIFNTRATNAGAYSQARASTNAGTTGVSGAGSGLMTSRRRVSWALG